MSLCYLLDEAPADLTGYFAYVAAQPFAMLLDSAAPEHPNSRFDILVAQPVATLCANGSHCTLTKRPAGHPASTTTPADAAANNDCSELLVADPLLLIKQLQQQLLPALDKAQWSAEGAALPFVGGVLGYFAYDLGRVLEPLPARATADIGLPDVAVGFYDWALVLDKTSRQLWFCDLTGDARQRWPHIQPLFSQANTEESFTLTGQWQANMTAQSHQQKIAAVHAYLHSGDCYQINLAQRFRAPYQGDEYQAYLALRAANQAPFSAFIRLPEGAVLSVSPERFLEVKDQLIETKPIKGTRPRFADRTADANSAALLQQSAKDRAENVMIVDLLRNDLGKVAAAGTVRVPQLFAIESFPAVHHLVSTVTAELAPQYQAIDALRAAFPGGSITGAPKVRAMQIIEELEPHRRSVYCGAIGYISQHGHMDTSIAIRTLVASGGTLYCWAGGGIVADSEASSEYQETLDKVARILPVLAAL